MLYSQVVAAVISALDPADVCQLAGLCPGAAALAGMAQGPLDCPMCRVLAATLLQRFKDPKVRDAMHKGLLEACDELAPAKQVRVWGEGVERACVGGGEERKKSLGPGVRASRRSRLCTPGASHPGLPRRHAYWPGSVPPANFCGELPHPRHPFLTNPL